MAREGAGFEESEKLCQSTVRLGPWISELEVTGDKSGFSGKVGTAAGLEYV